MRRASGGYVFGYAQLYSNRTGTTVNTSEIEVYLVLVLLLYSSAIYRQRLVENGVTLGFLSAKMEKCKES